MSAKACGLTSFSTGAMDGGGAKEDGESRTERIERYKKQRREELARHYVTKAAVSEENSAVAAAKGKGGSKPADTEGQVNKSAVTERRNVAPSVRMTKASRLRALSHAASAQGASAEQHPKLELPHRGERQSLRPLDLNDNIPSKAQASSGNSRSESKPAAGLAKVASAEKGPLKRKPPTTVRPSPPRSTMGQLQSRRSGTSGVNSRPVSDEKPQPICIPEDQAENIVPGVNLQHGAKPLDAFDTFGEDDSGGTACSSAILGEEQPQTGVFNKHCSALPDLPCDDKEEPASPKVFSVTFHTTSTSYLRPSGRQAPSCASTAAQVWPSDSRVSSTRHLSKSPPRFTKPESPARTTKPEALRPWTKSYSPVKQQPLTARRASSVEADCSATCKAKSSASQGSSATAGSQEILKRGTEHRIRESDRSPVCTETLGTLQSDSVVPVNAAQSVISLVPAKKELVFPEPEHQSASVQLEASKQSASLPGDVAFEKREAVCEEESVAETRTEELKLQKKSERSASFSESVHGILKSNTREDDSSRPRHSILKNRSSSSEERDHSPELHSILKSKEDIAKPEDTAKPKPILKKHEETSVLAEPKPILKRKSVDEDTEERLKPILKNQQQRRWSHEHSPDKGDAVVVRRRSHSTELESKPVLSFVETPSSASVRTSVEQKPELGRLHECVVIDSAVTSQTVRLVPESKVVCCPPLDSALGHSSTDLPTDVSPHVAVVGEVALESSTSAALASPSLVGFSGGASPQQKRYFRRNASCYKTQPVTANEIKASDCLESVRSFRNLVLKEASLSIFNKEGLPRQEVQTCFKKPEFPLPYSPPSKSIRQQRERRRTLPVTSEEVEEAIKMDAAGHKRTSPMNIDAAKASDSADPSKLSVAEKVSMFKKSVVLDAPQNGAERKRPPRFSIAERRQRAQTQPVTTEEVQLAAKEMKEQDKQPEAKEDDLSKMSLADKLKMFNQKVTLEVLQQKPPVRSNSMRRSLGPQTGGAEPATPVMGTTASLGVPLARTRSHSSPPEDSAQPTSAAAPKGILKVQAGPQPVVKSILKQEHPEVKEDVKGILKPEQPADCAPTTPVKPILKPEKSSPEVESPKSTSSESSSEEEEEEEEEEKGVDEEEESSSESSSDSSSEEDSDTEDTKKILLGGQRHLVITQGSSPQPGRKIISNPAVQRKLNASLRRKEEERRSTHEVLSSEARLRSSYSGAGDNGLQEISSRGLYVRETNRTQPITQDEKITCGGGIAQRLEALRKSGEDWQKRVEKTKEDLTKSDTGAASPVSVLRKEAKIIEVQKSPSIGDRKSWLESSSESWRQRVQESDASQFTVAGKMGISESAAQLADRKKRTPKQETFSPGVSSKAEVLRRIHQQGTPVLPSIFKSKSMPNAAEELARLKAEEEERPRVLIPKADNETFTSFFESVLPSSKDEKLDISEAAFDAVVSDNVKLGQRKQVSVRRKRQTKGNPLKALASRTDIRAEYVEVRSDIAEKELKRINIEKLAKTSDLAPSALAGLVSTEDFRRVQLKKSDDTTSLLPNRDLILIQVKGRRHVQTRLVEPSVSSLNHGDVFVLVTPTTVYCWIGRHSNVIERAKATDVAQSIQSKKDLHFKGTSEVKIIDEEKEESSKDTQAFFKLLGGAPEDCNPAGDPGEDLRFEAAIVDTNMVYTVEGDALVPYDKYWGMQPRVEMLQPDKAYVFNFGSEVYVWLGKLVPSEVRDLSVRLAEEQCKAGFDYSDCDINPLFPRAGPEEQKFMASNVRPNWTLFAKVNQHMEPVLFKEKFLDWPDDAKLIRVKNKAKEDSKSDSLDSELKPCDAKELLEKRPAEPDLELSGSHLGRGLEYYDVDERRQYHINTLAIKVWHITEYEHRTLPESSYGQFYSGDTYVVRWQYAVSQTGRHLSGQRSRHVAAGRERCAYFFWHGRDSTVTEQGACALLTVELDEERGPHVRVLQGREPPCFLNLFKGKMVVYSGKRQEEPADLGDWRMFVVRGECPLEAALVETSVGVQNLRSRGSFLVLSRSSGRTYLWHGAKCCAHAQEVAEAAAKAIIEQTPVEMAVAKDVELKLTEAREGAEERSFWDAFGGDKKKKQHLFVSLLDSTLDFDFTPRLFHMTLVSGTFEANEVFCPFRKTDVPCAYPFLQSDLYSATQPAVFFLDNRHEMYIWQGWWPSNDSETGLPRVPNSSEKVRWNTTRRLAMETALHYSQEMNPSDPPKVYLVFAGLEPVEFTCLFPEWQDRDDIATINIREDRNHGDRLSVQETLAQLTKTHYTLDELKSVPLPEGVDPKRLESYLTDEDFEAEFKCTKAEFYGLPHWMQNKHKKQAGLF